MTDVSRWRDEGGAAEIDDLRVISTIAEAEVPRQVGPADGRRLEHQLDTILRELSRIDQLCAGIAGRWRDGCIHDCVPCATREICELDAGSIIQHSGIEADFRFISALRA